MESTQLLEVRMSVAVEAIGKQVGNKLAAKLAGRKADIVDYQQIDFGVCRARIKIRRSSSQYIAAPAIGPDREPGKCRLSPLHG